MLRPRLIPCLLIKDKGLVKTVKFSKPKYVGDPINAVRIFNEKHADELIIADIDVSANNSDPDFELIEKLATECRMPLCYCGGIRSVDQAATIISLGVEKVGLSAAAIADPDMISRTASRIGSQSVVVVLDVKRTILGGYAAYTLNGKKKSKVDPFLFAKEAELRGAGEILINSIDRDGTMEGYDEKLISKMREVTHLPMTCLGGAGNIDDMKKVVQQHKILGMAAGSMFVFKGRYRAVLINYPPRKLKETLWTP